MMIVSILEPWMHLPSIRQHGKSRVHSHICNSEMPRLSEKNDAMEKKNDLLSNPTKTTSLKVNLMMLLFDFNPDARLPSDVNCACGVMVPSHGNAIVRSAMISFLPKQRPRLVHSFLLWGK